MGRDPVGCHFLLSRGNRRLRGGAFSAEERKRGALASDVLMDTLFRLRAASEVGVLDSLEA